MLNAQSIFFSLSPCKDALSRKSKFELPHLCVPCDNSARGVSSYCRPVTVSFNPVSGGNPERTIARFFGYFLSRRKESSIPCAWTGIFVRSRKKAYRRYTFFRLCAWIIPLFFLSRAKQKTETSAARRYRLRQRSENSG